MYFCDGRDSGLHFYNVKQADEWEREEWEEVLEEFLLLQYLIFEILS